MSDATPRYLAPFHPKRVPHFFTDVLIIGGGLAGLRAALAVDPELSVLVITKDEHRSSPTAPTPRAASPACSIPDDRFEDHVADTLVAGGRCATAQVVELVVREAPAADPRADRLGHAVRPGRRAAWPWAARAATATTASSTPWATPPARRSCGR